jgi:cellulose synthase/poly-beta-1,6-N-acetylglucosamine synthase-like glycosyltransferase
MHYDLKSIWEEIFSATGAWCCLASQDSDIHCQRSSQSRADSACLGGHSSPRRSWLHCSSRTSTRCAGFYEIIVVDDGSSDETWEILLKISSTFPI